MVLNVIIYSLKIYVFVMVLIFIAIFFWNLIEDKIKTFLKGRSSIIYFLIGILSMGSSTVWIPLIGEIENDYFKISLFMFGRAIKLLLIPMQIALLGLKLTIFINLYILFITPLVSYILKIIMEH